MDLKLKEVAELLNISEATVRRLLSEGKIPAYKINGQFRVNRSEIEDLVMNQKLNLEQEMKEIDLSLKGGNRQFSLYRAIYRGEVLKDISESSKEGIIRHTMEYMASRFDLDAEVLTDLFLDREKMMSTALNVGIAVPHTRDFFLHTHFDVIITVFPKTPIEYGALDGKPVHTLFFLFANEDKSHLNLLAKVAHLSNLEKNRSFLQTKPTKEHLLDFVKQWEGSLTGN